MILLTKSKKHGGYCTAGIDVEKGKWIRIVGDINSDRDEIYEMQLTYEDGSKAEIMDIIAIDCIQHCPNYFQPENYVMNNEKKWIYLGKATLQQVLELHPFEQRENLYYDYYYRISDEDIKEIQTVDMYSLTIVNLVNPIVKVSQNPNSGNKTVALNFRYLGRNYSYFRITDSDIFDRFYNYDYGEYTLWGNYIAVISLGENYYGYHYKLVAEIIPYIEEQAGENVF